MHTHSTWPTKVSLFAPVYAILERKQHNFNLAICNLPLFNCNGMPFISPKVSWSVPVHIVWCVYFQDKCKVTISNAIATTFMKISAHMWIIFSFILCQERIPESPSPAPSLEESHRPGSQTSSHPSSSVSSSPSQMDHHSERMGEWLPWRK